MGGCALSCEFRAPDKSSDVHQDMDFGTAGVESDQDDAVLALLGVCRKPFCFSGRLKFDPGGEKEECRLTRFESSVFSKCRLRTGEVDVRQEI